MKIKNKIIISLLIIILSMIISTKVEAVSAKLSASSTNVTPGTKVTITTTIKGASWQISLSGAVSGNYSDSTSDAEDTTKTETTSFTPSSEGTYKVSLSGNVTGSNDSRATSVSDSITITVKEKSNSDNTSGGGTSKLSTDATLKNLGITPNDFTGFKKATTTYNVAVPKSTEKISIYATPTDKNATVTGTGSKTLKVGKNTFNIKVTAEDKKTTKTYTLNITRKSEDELSTDANLSNLGIRPKQYDFTGFKMNKTDYEVSVPKNVEKINIYAYASSSKATVNGTGEKTLKDGENKFEVVVTAEDKKTTKTYNLTVTRKDDEEKTEENPDENNKKIDGVKDIKVVGYTLSPAFSQDVYEYKVNITGGESKIDVKVEAADNIEAEVVGNENLKIGENTITILVRDTQTDATTTYQITANVKNAEAATTTNTTQNTTIDLSELNSEMNKVQLKLKIRDWIVRIAIIAIIILIIIYLVERYRLQDDEDYEDEEDDDDEDISETRLFYSQMEKDKQNEEQNNPEESHKRKRGYQGKRFKD